MFEIVSLTGTPEERIEVQTRRGTSIANSQALAPDARQIQAFERLLTKHPQWIPRKNPCGLYNCAGHVWASRRTAIYEEKWYDFILREDGYRLLRDDEPVWHGDLAIYRFIGVGGVCHVGAVQELRGIMQGDRVSGHGSPWILSKWGDSGGEVLHHVRNVPWKDGDYEVTFWTDRS